ncbi:hypothetical protein FCR2A7T_29340 [Flavobacterium cauense R2A-7]|uniref:hypothetical protein n=1 Tax=Flavobacterium cauense TaxID=510946 RepID=UPI0003C6236A|nr:hypothetical protein [Flavobacterium cauense]ESU18452.1 hypothetical protein FCR2A7T_29340 [Flavobacterium cauense R2A-7]KGO78580.1 hypothetical protein Q762_15140 [Flavobacterium cauense R2A-7]
MRIFLEMLGGHVLISIVTCYILFLITEFQETNSVILFVVFMFLLFLYFYSGYYYTKERTNWYKYFSVAIIGILFWIICASVSSGNTNYKENNNAGIWFLYELYILPKSSLVLNSDHYSLKLDLFQKFIFPIIFSLFQFTGGYIKVQKVKNSR